MALDLNEYEYYPLECNECEKLVAYFFTYEEWPATLCPDCYDKAKRQQKKN